MASTLAATNGDEIPPLPPHWIFDGEQDSPNYTGSLAQKVVLNFHRTLCLVSFGGTGLRQIWERSHTMDSGTWEEGRNSLRERIQHTNIVVRFSCFGVGEHFLDFCRQVYFLPQSQPSAAPTHPRILDSFRTRKRVLLLSCSSPSDYPSPASLSGPQSYWWSGNQHPPGSVM